MKRVVYHVVLSSLVGLFFVACAAAGDTSDENTESESVSDEAEIPLQVKVTSEVFVDGELKSSPRIVTIDERPFRITHQYDEAPLLVVNITPVVSDERNIALTGDIYYGNEFVEEIDDVVEGGELYEVSLHLEHGEYDIEMIPTITTDDAM